MTMIEGPVRALVKIGVLDVILPFVLVFTITFGILRKTNVLGKEQQNANILLSATLALTSVIAVNVLNIVNALIMYLSVLIVAGILLAMIFGLAGAELKNPHKIVMSVLAIVFLITVMYVLVNQGVIDKNLFFSRLMLPLIVLIAIIATVIYIVKGKDEAKKTEEKIQTAPKLPRGLPALPPS